MSVNESPTCVANLFGDEWLPATIIETRCVAGYNDPPHDHIVVDVNGHRWAVDQDRVKPR